MEFAEWGRLRGSVNNTWLFDELFDEVTEEFSGDIINSLAADNELLSAPSGPLVRSSDVGTACYAPLQTVSTQEEESFLQSVFERVSCSFPELALTMADNTSGSPVLTITQKNLCNHPPFGLTSRIQVVVQYTSYTARAATN